MDPFSLTAGCVGLVTAITQLSGSILTFISGVRSARADLDSVSRELLSLKTVLELLQIDLADDAIVKLPDTLQRQVSGIITNCAGVVRGIQIILEKHEGRGVQKAAQWTLSGRADVDKLRISLEAHKSALEIALDMIQL
jgi:hypothetical protein